MTDTPPTSASRPPADPALPVSDLTLAVVHRRYWDLVAAAQATVAAGNLELPDPAGPVRDELSVYDLLPPDYAAPEDLGETVGPGAAAGTGAAR